MKLTKIVKKNFKIILRSKSSAFVVLVGPLLILALITLMFSNTTEYKLSIGMVSTEGELVNNFKESLTNKGYDIVDYTLLEECVNNLKLGKTNICVKFPEDISVENNKTNVIEFYVDESRLNLVESITSSVSQLFTIQSDEVSLDLTNKLIETINIASGESLNGLESVSNIQYSVETSTSKNNQISSLGDNEYITEASDDISTIDNKASIIKNSLNNINTLSSSLENAADDFDNTTELKNDVDDYLEDLDEETVRMDSSISELEDNIDELDGQIDSAKNDFNLIKNNAGTLTTELSNIKTNADNLDQNLNTIQNKVNEVKITSASNIINPFSTKVNSITTNSDNSTYMFPYLVTLIILFVGIMFSSTLVVMEKKSRAFFRTFTTPTNEVSHILARYITNFIVIIFQLSIVITVGIFYMKMPLLSNYKVTLLLLFMSTTLFIFLGTLIGILFRTQEGTTIASISLGSLSLFLSNLVLPIESYSPIIKKIMLLNPYMLCSELLKKSIVFKASFTDLYQEIIILIGYVILLIVLVFLFQKISFKWLFKIFNRKILKRSHFTRENYFRLDNGKIIKDKKELFLAIEYMNNKEYNKYINKGNNEIALWVKDILEEKKLAKKIRKASNVNDVIKVFEETEKMESKKSKNKKSNKKEE